MQEAERLQLWKMIFMHICDNCDSIIGRYRQNVGCLPSSVVGTSIPLIKKSEYLFEVRLCLRCHTKRTGDMNRCCCYRNAATLIMIFHTKSEFLVSSSARGAAAAFDLSCSWKTIVAQNP